LFTYIVYVKKNLYKKLYFYRPVVKWHLYRAFIPLCRIYYTRKSDLGKSTL